MIHVVHVDSISLPMSGNAKHSPLLLMKDCVTVGSSDTSTRENDVQRPSPRCQTSRSIAGVPLSMV